MQTFLPYASFKDSAKVLDKKRLGNQRVEASILIKGGWSKHPAYIMWVNYIDALKEYFNIISEEWVNRGYVHNMGFFDLPTVIDYPRWLGDERVHSSHRSALLFKYYEWYSKFGWKETPEFKYFWPSHFYKKL